MGYCTGVDLARAAEIFERHSKDFITAYIFGSVADGTADALSDIDVILVRDTNRLFFDRVREVMDLRLEFRNADMMIYTQQRRGDSVAQTGRERFGLR